MSPSHLIHPDARTLEACGGKGRGAGGLTLITEGPLPGSPLETLNDAVLHRAEKSLVHLHKT